ncbi:MAG: hypothetical protein ACFE9L_14975 [Candidatus Hodarchaeota archaeon]
MLGNEISHKINIIGTPVVQITKLIQQSTTVAPRIIENKEGNYQEVTQVIKQGDIIFNLQYTFWNTIPKNWRDITKGKPEFYQNTDGVILVFDYGNRNSFTDLQAWNDEVMQYSPPHIPIVLLGIKNKNEEISRQMVREFAEKLHLKQFESSLSNPKVLRRFGRILVKQILQYRYEPLLKICIIGSETNLNHKFGNLTADSKWSTNYLPTLGHDMPTKRVIIEKTLVKLIIMILAGQEFFGKLRTSYYRGTSGCLILFDKGSEKSFTSVPDWYDEFKTNVKDPSIPVALVGIKSYKNVITSEKGQEVADQLKIGYYETKITDRRQISQIIHEMTEKMVNSKDGKFKDLFFDRPDSPSKR